MSEVQMPATASTVAPEQSETIVDTTVELAGGTDAPETVAETDEDINARELKATQDRAEKRARGVQKRLDELTADKYEARRQADEARQQAQYFRAQLERQSQAAPPQGTGEPDRSKFQDYEAYLEARTDWRAEQRARAIVGEQLAQANQHSQEAYQRQQAEQASAQLARELTTKQQAYAKDHADYFDVVNNDDIQVPPPAAIAIMRHKDAPALMYHLGKNPALAESLHGMAPMEQAIAVGELAAVLKRTPQVSKAPPPGTPTGARSGGPKPVSSMSADEYYAHITKGRGSKK